MLRELEDGKPWYRATRPLNVHIPLRALNGKQSRHFALQDGRRQN